MHLQSCDYSDCKLQTVIVTADLHTLSYIAAFAILTKSSHTYIITQMLMCVQGALHHELPTIDVSEELHYLWSCQQVFSPTKAVLQQIVIDAQGSLPTTVSMLLEWAPSSQARNHAACQELWSACNDPLQQSWQGVAPASNGSEGSSARAVASCKAFSQGWQQQQTQLLTEAMQGAGVALLCHFVCCIRTVNISNK